MSKKERGKHKFNDRNSRRTTQRTSIFGGLSFGKREDTNRESTNRENTYIMWWIPEEDCEIDVSASNDK